MHSYEAFSQQNKRLIQHSDFERMVFIMARNNHFGGFGGGANMQQLMRQAQKLQEQMTKAQEELDEREYSAQAGGGMISVTVTGKRELKALEIKPEFKSRPTSPHPLFLGLVSAALKGKNKRSAPA